MSRLLDSAQLRLVEQQARAASPSLMERAGQQAADWITENHPHISRILILAGPGNNGGDGLILARVLLEKHIYTKALLAYPSLSCSNEATKALRQLPDTATLATLGPEDLDHYDLIVDALFGIGLARPLDTTCAKLSTMLATRGKPVIALDVPSGINADTGSADPHAICAAATLTFIADKPGLHTGAAVDYCGEIHCLDLGLPETALPASTTHLIDAARIGAAASSLRRMRDSHKGRHGTVQVVGGNDGMQGAGLLAARAALHAGAGKVRLLQLANQPLGIDPLYPEIMCHDWTDGPPLRSDVSHRVIGPGMGCDSRSRALLADLLASPEPAVIDADALNLIAQNAELGHLLCQRDESASIITPHPLEGARLLGMSCHDVQRDRLHAAKMLSQKFNVVCVLKGAGTIIATPDGVCHINSSGNAALASAGQGDILAGCIAALWAQGAAACEAACLAVYVHGKGADSWRAENPLGLGLDSGETLRRLRASLNQLT